MFSRKWGQLQRYTISLQSIIKLDVSPTYRYFLRSKNSCVFWHICTFGILQIISETVEKGSAIE